LVCKWKVCGENYRKNKEKKIITAAPVIKKAVLADSEIKEDLFFD
jgi:hypothetical protein